MTRVRFLPLLPAAAVAILLGCAGSTSSGNGTPSPESAKSAQAPSPDPRIGLKAGLRDAGEAAWNLKVVSENPRRPSSSPGSPTPTWRFTGKYAIQGNYNGFQVWDISNPAKPALDTGYVCPASQSDVSVYKNLLFVSGEDLSARLDCGAQGVQDTVSTDRLRGLRIFDITDIHNPKNVGNVQTCRGSHTHSRAGRSEGHRERLRLHLGVRRGALAPASCRAARPRCRTRIRTRRCSGSR